MIAWIESFYQAGIILGATLVFDFIQRTICSRLLKKADQTDRLRYAFLGALSVPLSLLSWIVALTFAAQTVVVFPMLILARKLGVIVSLTWFFIRLIKKVENSLPGDRTTSDAIGKILRIAVMIVSGLSILQTLDFSLSGILAFGGVGGIAIGFAAKDMLANFFGAFMLYWDRPFKIGDRIRSSDREIEGFVEHIGWRLTRIRNLEKQPIYVPNSLFSTITILNVSRMSHRRIREFVGIRYDDIKQIEPIVNEIREMVMNHPGIASKQALYVNFHNFGPSSLDILLHMFTKATDYKNFLIVKEDVLLKASEIIAKHKAEIAYPTTTLHVQSTPNIPQMSLPAQIKP